MWSCNRHAGLNGASTTSDLGPWLLDGKPAAAIVVALGTNDALGAARSRPQFEANYSAAGAAFKSDNPCDRAGDSIN
jgi:hypothetical protein